MIRSVIIDDEQHCIDRLEHLLTRDHTASVEVAGTALTVKQGIKIISDSSPDLLFLDVQLNQETGFDLLRQLNGFDFAIIFTTAYEKFAIQAIKFSAIDYLLKPIDEDDLSKALIKALSITSDKMNAEKINILLQNTKTTNVPPKKIIIPTISGMEFLELSDIIRCQSDINYTTIYLADKQKIVVAKTLKEFEEMLKDHCFFRIHNSHLINLAYLKSYHKGKGGSVILKDGTELDVSSRRKEAFLQKLSTL